MNIEPDAKRIALMMRPSISRVSADRFELQVGDRRLDHRIGRRRARRAPRGRKEGKGRSPRSRPLNPAAGDQLDRSPVVVLKRRKAGFDAVDPELVEQPRDLELLGGIEHDADRLPHPAKSSRRSHAPPIAYASFSRPVQIKSALFGDLIWTGRLNDAYAIGGRVGLYDTTLRDGEQTVGVVLDPDQKLEIARLLDDLGVDRIEAGFPRVSDDDWRAVELIAAAGLRAEIWGFSRAVPADLEALVELGVRYSVIESPISDLKLEAIGVSREKMLGRITSAMRFAAEHGIMPRSSASIRRARRRTSTGRSLGGGRGRSQGSRRRRHARDRIARSGRGARRLHRRGSSTCPCTSTATTTSVSPPRAPLPRYVPARRTCTARSTAWASGPATPTSARSR